MDIVTKQSHRVLAYVEALNRHGVKPHPYLVNQFAEQPDQRVERVGGFQAITLLAMLGERTVPKETFTDYMARLGWVTVVSERVELSTIGRALLKALNAPAIEETTADVFEIVLDPKNPFAYAQALGGMSSVKNALLVEPWFRLEQLIVMAEFDNITRVLIGSKLKPAEYELLATGLAALSRERKLEIRKAQDLHDRYLIPADDGNVRMLGVSLGGIGKSVSTMTTLGEVASRALREAHEELWRRAEVIEPKTPPQPVAGNLIPSAEEPAGAAPMAPAKKTAAKKSAPRRNRGD